MAKHDLWSVRATAKAALSNGAERVGHTRIYWDVAGRCHQPATVIRFARPPRARDGSVTINRKSPQPMEVEISAPCRKCPPCLRRRAALWRHRATTEINRSSRTWFCTWTLNPDARFRTLSEARAASSAKSVQFEELEPAEQFGYWVRAIGREITLGLKRLRKNTGHKLRYIVIAEGHKDGTPHLHGLVHELHPLSPITHKALVQNVWRLGFARYKLADAGSSGYVTKYLTKTSLVRVRASGGYGLDLDHKERSECEPSTSSFRAVRRKPGEAQRGTAAKEKALNEVPF